MPATATEAYLGQRSSGKAAERPWIIKGASSDSDARTALLAAAPTTLGSMNRIDADCDVEEIDSAGGIYSGRVVYATNEFAPKPPNTFHVSFDISGQTVKIKRSLNTQFRAGFWGAHVAVNYGGMINVNQDGTVEGLDIFVPTMNFQVEYTFDAADVTQEWINTVSTIVGNVNDATFLGYDAGELLLMRISGQRRDDGNYDITFGFAVSKNQYNLQLRGDSDNEFTEITIPEKRGWDYLWFSHIDHEDTTNHVIRTLPRAAYVEQVYYDDDFDLLGI